MTKDEIREAAEADLETFIRLVAPYQVIGSIHSEWCRWTTSEAAGNHQLTLLPRDHGKSRYIAFKAAWYVVRRPDIRILYISSTSNLAEKQLYFIKQILTSPAVRRYWPELINEEEGKREKWTNTEIAVDHPIRKKEGVRDSTIFTGGLTTSLTGLHCDIAILDDVVVQENAYTQEGRDKVRTQYSLLSSIEGGEAEEWVVGTRYHPKDLYNDMQTMEEDIYDDNGDLVSTRAVYTTFERQVEDSGMGVGQFLWARQQRADGRWFGFDQKILATKRAKYLDKRQFRAQYYNDPNDPGDLRINREKFQYYEPKHLKYTGGYWYMQNNRLNVFASVDFAYSVSKRSDYTAIVVIGVDKDNNIYVLDIARFQTEKISEYFDNIRTLHVKWNFKKLGAETTAAQKAIVRELKEGYIKPYGLNLSIEELSHSSRQGSKEERIGAILEPRYDNMAIWHYRGGYCQTLEDELVAQYPPHDDVMDALAAAISISVPPIGNFNRDFRNVETIAPHPKFGGLGIL
jgi:phage terminase large subunit-like protein